MVFNGTRKIFKKMEYKTFKDLKYLGIAHKGHYKREDAMRFQDNIFERIKKEAVKTCLFYERHGKSEKAEAIAEFFNITDEDLK